MIGLQYPKTLGQIHFWIPFFGVNLTFFPMHFLGLVGMPHHIPNYPNAYTGWNAFSSFGSYVFVIGFFCFFVVGFLTLTSENKCAPSPWAVGQDSTTFEWMIKSPLAFHRFQNFQLSKKAFKRLSRWCHLSTYPLRPLRTWSIKGVKPCRCLTPERSW
jgi:cytochrome c oxidase subunit 1